jgi:hypothetical protein
MKTLTLRNTIVFALTALAAAGCGSSNSNPVSTTSSLTVTGLTLAPTSVSLALNASTQFTASGGTTPYVFQLTSGSGSLNSVTGYYQAPGAATDAVIRVIDAAGATATASVFVATTGGSTSTAPCYQPDEKLVIPGRSINSLTLSCFDGCYMISKSYSGSSVPCTWMVLSTTSAALYCRNDGKSSVDMNHVRLKCSR